MAGVSNLQQQISNPGILPGRGSGSTAAALAAGGPGVDNYKRAVAAAVGGTGSAGGTGFAAGGDSTASA